MPESDYLVFFHPPFDYIRDNAKVMGIVESIAWNFDPEPIGYKWNETEPGLPAPLAGRVWV